MKSRHLTELRAIAFILVLAAVSATSAQTPRVTFGATTSTVLSARDPAGQVVGDFNQDGHLDLLVTSKIDPSFNVNLFTGDGAGSLSHARGFVFTQATAVAAGDFDGNGALDVAITQDLVSKNGVYGDPVCGSVVGVALFLGPHLSSARCVATVPRAIAVQTGDFDRDGRMDIALVSALGQGLRIYSEFNFADYTLKVTTVPDSFVSATSMAPPADLNGDGTLDLVVGHTAGVRTFLGHGDGTFAVGGDAASNRTQAVAVGLLNGDTRPDIAWIESGTSARLLAAFDVGDGTLSTQVVSTIGAGLGDVAIADIDHDGHTDLVVAHKGEGTIRIFFGSGDGTFATSPALALSAKPKLLAVRDWDEDGDLDVGILDASINDQNALARVALQNGSGPTDVTPPAMALTSPAAGALVTGTTAITASASDDVGVTRVEFFAGATLIGKSAGPNYIVSWDTRTSPNGPVTLTARAFDAALNESQWSAVEVTVENAPPPDTTAPVVNAPVDAIIEATGPDGAPFTFGVLAIDDVDGAVPVSCDRASGSIFALAKTTVTCTATDAHGNIGSASFTVTVRDTTAPVVTVPPNATVEATAPTGAVFTYTATAIDLVDGSPAVTCASPSGATFPLGATSVTCTATDTQGNSISASFTVTVTDTTVPLVTVPANATLEATASTGTSLLYTASASDLVDGSIVVNCTPASGATFPLDTTTVSCTAVDAHGNAGSASFTVTVTDTTAPVVTVPANASIEAMASTGATFSYSVTATDLVDGGLAVSCTPASGATFPLGATTVTCTASDAHGNASSASFSVTVTDTTPPVVTVPESMTIEATGPAGAAATYAASATDTLDGVVAVSCTPASGATFPFGVTTVSCTATDAHGNTGSAFFTVTVRDTTPPQITVLSDVTVEATGQAGAAIPYTVSALDGSDGIVDVTCTPVSGATFPFGATIVTCTASDAHGNASSASFIVIVTDTTPPVVTVPESMTIEATGPAGAAAIYAASATDTLDGVVAVSCTPASGATFPFGVTTVSCTATDARGNTGSAFFTVTVRDTTPPQITVPSDVTVEATGQAGAAIPYTVSAIDGINGIVDVTCTPASGATFPLGATTVTCTASDAFGNASSASFTVTVTDTTPP